jgi:hypothetical protein
MRMRRHGLEFRRTRSGLRGLGEGLRFRPRAPGGGGRASPLELGRGRAAGRTALSGSGVGSLRKDRPFKFGRRRSWQGSPFQVRAPAVVARIALSSSGVGGCGKDRPFKFGRWRSWQGSPFQVRAPAVVASRPFKFGRTRLWQGSPFQVRAPAVVARIAFQVRAPAVVARIALSSSGVGGLRKDRPFKFGRRRTLHGSPFRARA